MYRPYHVPEDVFVSVMVFSETSYVHTPSAHPFIWGMVPWYSRSALEGMDRDVRAADMSRLFPLTVTRTVSEA